MLILNLQMARAKQVPYTAIIRVSAFIVVLLALCALVALRQGSPALTLPAAQPLLLAVAAAGPPARQQQAQPPPPNAAPPPGPCSARELRGALDPRSLQLTFVLDVHHGRQVRFDHGVASLQ